MQQEFELKLVHFIQIHKSSGYKSLYITLGHWPAQPFSRPMADPTLLTRPRGLQTTPWLPINTRVLPLTQVIHS